MAPWRQRVRRGEEKGLEKDSMEDLRVMDVILTLFTMIVLTAVNIGHNFSNCTF